MEILKISKFFQKFFTRGDYNKKRALRNGNFAPRISFQNARLLTCETKNDERIPVIYFFFHTNSNSGGRKSSLKDFLLHAISIVRGILLPVRENDDI